MRVYFVGHTRKSTVWVWSRSAPIRPLPIRHLWSPNHRVAADFGRVPGSVLVYTTGWSKITGASKADTGPCAASSAPGEMPGSVKVTMSCTTFADPASCSEAVSICGCAMASGQPDRYLRMGLIETGQLMIPLATDSSAPHFGQRSGWHARQNGRPQLWQGPRAAATTRCNASSHTRRGRSAEALHSHLGVSNRRANGFQSR